MAAGLMGASCSDSMLDACAGSAEWSAGCVHTHLYAASLLMGGHQSCDQWCISLPPRDTCPNDLPSCHQKLPALLCRSFGKRQVMLSAIVRLQSLWRGRQQRHSFLTLRAAACTIQVLFPCLCREGEHAYITAMRLLWLTEHPAQACGCESTGTHRIQTKGPSQSQARHACAYRTGHVRLCSTAKKDRL